MAKKGSFLKVLLVGAAVAAGACYYASKKKTDIPTDMDDDLDLDDELDDVEEKAEPKRPYTNLNFSDVEAKVQTVVTKVADVATAAAEKAAPIITAAEEKVIEFFDDRRANTDAVNTAADEVAAANTDAAAEDASDDSAKPDDAE